MIQLLSVLLSLPYFSTVIYSDGAQLLEYSRGIDNGYLAVGANSPEWGGIPQALISVFDEYGMVSSQSALSFSGEPLTAVDFQSGAVILAADAVNGESRLVFIDASGNEQWISLFTGEFMSDAALCTDESDLFLSSSGSGFLKVAGISDQGAVLWNNDYPAIEFTVRDMCTFDESIYILGTLEHPGWQSDLSLLKLNLSGGNPELLSIIPPTGRYSPEVITVDLRGIFILVNTMTESSGMYYETQLIKLNEAGVTQWTGSLAGSSWNRGTDMISLDDGGFVLCGWTNSIPVSESNRSDLSIAKFSESGDLLWERKHGTSSPDYGLNIAAVSDEGLIIAGCVTEVLYQGWLLKTDSLGYLEPQGFEESGSASFSAYPLCNPVRNAVLSLAVVVEQSEILDVSTFDLSGRLVQTANVAVPPGNNTLNLSFPLPAGVYSVRISGESGESVFRTVVCGGVK